VPASGPHANRNQVLRFTVTGDVGASPTVIVDDLPTATVHNSGDLEFGPDGMLYVTVGDTDDPASAQQAGMLSGRVLRYTPLGAVPADNPSPASPQWCFGLRNTYDVTFEPTTGGLFGVENGPATDDELNFLQAGKDYGWLVPPPGGPGVGIRVQHWPEVIARRGSRSPCRRRSAATSPTTSSSRATSRPTSGASPSPAAPRHRPRGPFAAWSNVGFANKPLAITTGPNGTLYVSTFDAIYRFRKAP
jgi:glucose/arabinose dehydrogenase